MAQSVQGRVDGSRCLFRKSCASDKPCKYAWQVQETPRQTGGAIAVRTTRMDAGLCRRWYFSGLLLGVLTLAAVTLLAPPAPAAAQPLVQRQSFGRVHLTLSTDRQRMGFADRLQLTLGVEIPPEMAVVFPRVSGTLGPFSVHSQRLLAPQKTPAHTWHWQQEYILTAEHLGALTIPPLTVAVQDAGAASTAAPQHLTTEALVITVTPLLPEDADVTAPRDIEPPVSLVRPGVSLWLWGAVGVLGGFGLLVGTWGYRRWWHVTGQTIPPQPAHVLALAALEQLWREDLIAQQRLEEFYMRLSDTLRDYVTWRFGLCAATQTTDELLAATRTTAECLAAPHDLLGTCLRQCDQVKFARYRPAPDAILQAWESAKAFVEQTADARIVPTPGTTPAS